MRARISFSDLLWRFFVSIKVTLVLLAAWLGLSVAGTLIPQNAAFERLSALYGPDLALWIERLALGDVYHSTVYTLILLLLVLNLVACSLNTLPGKLALARSPLGPRPVTGSGRNYLTRRYRPLEGADPAAFEAELGKRFRLSRADTDTQTIVAERQTFSHFMVYLVHMGIVVIIVGGMVTSLFGFEGMMMLPEGRAQDQAFRQNSEERVPLGFSVRLDHFRFDRFPNGMPKTYASDVTFLEGGRDVAKRHLEVNSPTSYGGYNFYQSSYDRDGATWISGLMVSSDPGVVWVWVGSVIFTLGLYLTFYTAHQRVSARRDGDTWRVNAWCSRNPTGLGRLLDRAALRAGYEPLPDSEKERS